MPHDVEDRLRRSLAAEAREIEPDPATWQTVQTRIRRRAVARWSAVAVTAAAALVLAALVLPGLVNGTRVDLSPADPGAVSGGTSGLVSTDGRRIVVTDARGEVTAEIDPPGAGNLAIRRLAVRPGSTPEDLVVAYLLADADCDRAEMRWVRLTGAGTTSGYFDEGGGAACMTDPVWTSDGSVAAWVRRQPSAGDGGVALEPPPGAGGEQHVLISRGWFADGPEIDEPHANNQFTHLDVSPLEDDGPAVRALRATDWDWVDGQGTLRLSASYADGPAQAGSVGPIPQPRQPGDSIEMPVQSAPPELTLPASTVEPLDLPGDARPLVGVGNHDDASTPGGVLYVVVREPTGELALRRVAADHTDTVALPAAVGDAEQSDGGDLWLSAGGDTVVLGAGAHAWAIAWQDGGWGDLRALPGTVHADVLAPVAEPEPSPQPEPSAESEPSAGPAPVGLTYVGTDGDALVLHGPEGPGVLARAVADAITDIAVHPASTAGDLTVVWREGAGCAATLQSVRVRDGHTTVEAVEAHCPGRPVFSPDGSHLAWFTAPDGQAPQGEFGLEALAWADGPVGSAVGFGVRAEPAELAVLDLLDWVWTEGTATQTAGVLHLVGYDSHGTPSAYSAPISRQGDGALALPAGATAQQQQAIVEVDSHHNDGAAVGPSYTLEPVPGSDRNALRVTRSVDGDQSDAFDLPAGLLQVFGGAAEVDAVWMTARGDHVLLGDGAERAWYLPWAGEGWGQLRELDGPLRSAVPLSPIVAPRDPAPPQAGTGSADPQPGEPQLG